MPHDPYKALYVHLPFCVRRCRYCDFATEATPSDSPAIERYVEDLCLQVRRASKEGELGAVETVYLGGGTPSHVGLSRLSMLLYTLSLSMRLEPDVECTMEANPESFDARMAADIWALGVNRLSLGVQSLDDEVLGILGRPHDAQAALAAIAAAGTRFDNVSVDVMCGIPGQSVASLADTLQRLVDAGAKHVSVYPLAVEEGTPLYRDMMRGRFPEPDEDEQAEAMVAAKELLERAGFHRYEVASYALEGFECRHNKAYWTGKPYLGIGRSAATMTQNDQRRMRVTDGQVTDDLDRRQMYAEDLMLGMRMAAGVPRELVDEASSVLPDTKQVFARLVGIGLVEEDADAFRPTERGWLQGNELYGALFDLT